MKHESLNFGLIKKHFLLPNTCSTFIIITFTLGARYSAFLCVLSSNLLRKLECMRTRRELYCYCFPNYKLTHLNQHPRIQSTMPAKNLGTLDMVYAIKELQNPFFRKTMLCVGDMNNPAGRSDAYLQR